MQSYTGSYSSYNCTNPIRKIVENIKVTSNNEDLIVLSYGDPTAYGAVKTPDSVISSTLDALKDYKNFSYVNAFGRDDARKAIAEYSSNDRFKPTEKDVIITSGCSGALEICILAVANPGEYILLPHPGFSLYEVLAKFSGIKVKYYNLIPEKDWEADISKMDDLICSKTKAILINNPSNPTSAVYSERHLRELLKFAERHKLAVISDEVYEHMVFPGNKFISVSSIDSNVPVLICSGLTKRFLVPGWRLGWLVICSNNTEMSGLRESLFNLTGRILGSNTLVQAAVPKILKETDQSFFDECMLVFYKNLNIAKNILSDAPGLTLGSSNGAMYLIIKIEIEKFRKFKDDRDFCQGMLDEVAVFCLPCSAFKYSNWFRLVLTLPHDMMEKACQRIKKFAQDNYDRD